MAIYKVDGAYFSSTGANEGHFARAHSGRVIIVGTHGQKWIEVEPDDTTKVVDLPVRDPLGQVIVDLQYDHLYVP